MCAIKKSATFNTQHSPMQNIFLNVNGLEFLFFKSGKIKNRNHFRTCFTRDKANKIFSVPYSLRVVVLRVVSVCVVLLNGSVVEIFTANRYFDSHR